MAVIVLFRCDSHIKRQIGVSRGYFVGALYKDYPLGLN